MKKTFLNTAVLALVSLLLTGCGGGGGGGTAPKTSGSIALYLFGTMSSASKVASIKSQFTVPAGIMINYSSPPGATTGVHKLRSGSIVPSGLSMFSKDDFTSTYNLDNKLLTIGVVNNQMKDIKSNITGKGTEIATLSFKLTSPDALPIVPTPWQDSAVEVYQETIVPGLPMPETDIKTGLILNFVTSFY